MFSKDLQVSELGSKDPDVVLAAISEIMEPHKACGGTFLLGCPYTIQTRYWEFAKEGWQCLLQLDEDSTFNVGDGGTGQLFYRQKVDGSFEYKYYWSCY
jgi:hypothetical protein